MSRNFDRDGGSRRRLGRALAGAWDERLELLREIDDPPGDYTEAVAVTR
ncbi:MAG: hypothetical protein ACRDPZ_01520 [Gaiellaceae bacterium]